MRLEARKDLVVEDANEPVVRSISDHSSEQPDQHGGTVADNPGIPTRSSKYVASRSLAGPLEWNGTAIEGDAVDGVLRLKAELEGDLVMTGCGELARELIQAGLVDELYFWIHPTVQGTGTRPYEPATIPMRLLEARAFDSGVALLRYQPLTA
jgi:dihydrofolate reductase